MDKNQDKQLYKKQRRQERYIRNGLIATASVLGVVALGLGAWVYKLKSEGNGLPYIYIPYICGVQPYINLCREIRKTTKEIKPNILFIKQTSNLFYFSITHKVCVELPESVSIIIYFAINREQNLVDNYLMVVVSELILDNSVVNNWSSLIDNNEDYKNFIKNMKGIYNNWKQFINNAYV